MKFVIFVERIWDNDVFEELKSFINKKGVNKCILYGLTPANFTLMTSEQGYQGTKEEYSDILNKRYKELQDMGCKIQLHLHLSLRPEKMNQEPLFKESCDWMRSRKFECEEVMYGWYLSSSQSRELEKKYNLKFVKGKYKFNLHDYEIHNGIYGVMMILQNVRNCLR